MKKFMLMMLILITAGQLQNIYTGYDLHDSFCSNGFWSGWGRRGSGVYKYSS